MMPNERKIFSLLEVMQSIQRTLGERYGSMFWVKAEMNKLNHYPHSGHCYPDLVEKKDGKVIAQLRSTLWKDDYHRINHNFIKILKAPLKDGITMLFAARITFDPLHGLSLRILDIDPVFSLGELEREKQETISRLKAEDLFNANKALKLPLLPQRIAIISVETSKGYADFKNVINNNPWGYHFFYILFPSVLQGERAVESMLYQLKRIRKIITHFDVVAIIRGGGAEVGLSCFNNYQLTKEIASFPIPVITGIGHATNETVAETISFKNAITPTDLANFLIEKFHAFSQPIESSQRKLIDRVESVLSDRKVDVMNIAKYFKSMVGGILLKGKHGIRECSGLLAHQSRFLVHKEKEARHSLLYQLRKEVAAFSNRRERNIEKSLLTLKKDAVSILNQKSQEINYIQTSIANMSPENVLKRGYSISLINDKAIKSADDVRLNDVVTTITAKGSLTSEVKSVNKNSNDEWNTELRGSV